MGYINHATQDLPDAFHTQQGRTVASGKNSPFHSELQLDVSSGEGDLEVIDSTCITITRDQYDTGRVIALLVRKTTTEDYASWRGVETQPRNAFDLYSQDNEMSLFAVAMSVHKAARLAGRAA